MKRGKLLHDAPLAKYTTWRVGGPGDLVLIPSDMDELAQALNQLSEDTPITVIGLGSNVLIQDGGIRGLTIVMQGGGFNKLALLDETTVFAEAGVACGQLSRFIARNNLADAEFLAGIPGTVGGALTMNAGCYGGETWDIVDSVLMMDRQGETHWRNASEFDVSYRKVVKPVENELFIAATLKLNSGEKAASLAKIKALLAKRNATQPTNLPNCGSVFRNPEGHYAAQLIESVGLKGYQRGGAQISEKHANFIVNTGMASAKDIIALIELMKMEVKSKYNIELVTEVKVLGEEK